MTWLGLEIDLASIWDCPGLDLGLTWIGMRINLFRLWIDLARTVD